MVFLYSGNVFFLLIEIKGINTSSRIICIKKKKKYFKEMKGRFLIIIEIRNISLIFT